MIPELEWCPNYSPPVGKPSGLAAQALAFYDPLWDACATVDVRKSMLDGLGPWRPDLQLVSRGKGWGAAFSGQLAAGD